MWPIYYGRRELDLEAINSHASMSCKPSQHKKKRELLVGRKELLQVSIEKRETPSKSFKKRVKEIQSSSEPL
jgi:hypothetical protein